MKRKLSLLGLALLAPALGAATCNPAAVMIVSPADGSTVATHVVFVKVQYANLTAGTAQVLLDGVDRAAELATTVAGATTTVQGNLVVPASGPHVLVAKGSAPGPVEARSDFTLTPPAYYVPDDAVTGIWAVGTAGTVRGEIRAASHKLNGSGDREPQRYALMRVGYTQGLSASQGQWGVGARLSQTQLQVQRIPIPYPGDVVEVTGTLAKELFGAEERFVVNPVTAIATVSSPNPVLKDVGQSCANDMDCRDDLLCNRTTLLCETHAPFSWGGDPRGVNGACDDDSDCPAGQICKVGYTIKSPGADATYGANYAQSRDVGRKLCQVPDRNAPLASICPRTVTTDDLMSGRFLEGKEICLSAQVFLSVFNGPPLVPGGDRDVHSQLLIQNHLVYPEGDPPIALVQAATENAPPYRDPANPQGALGDLPNGAKLVVLGTVKYDDGHEWYEQHPYKWYRLTP